MELTWRTVSTALAISLLLSTHALAEVNDAGIKTKWGYVGNTAPAKWGKLSPQFAVCATGKSQSPINIPKKTKPGQDSLMIHYHPSPMVIVEDGETNLMLGTTQTLIHDGHGLQLNFDKGQHERINVNGKTYYLVQFHLHTPSETEMRGATSPLEIHFVHQSDDGHVAVVGVLVNAGNANAELQKLIDFKPQESGKPVAVKDQSINPEGLLPANRAFYSFMGSLTTPPCTEGLEWIVMANAITATPAQILELRRANGGANARPVQPLNKRPVSFNAGTKQ